MSLFFSHLLFITNPIHGKEFLSCVEGILYVFFDIAL